MTGTRRSLTEGLPTKLEKDMRNAFQRHFPLGHAEAEKKLAIELAQAFASYLHYERRRVLEMLEAAAEAKKQSAGGAASASGEDAGFSDKDDDTVPARITEGGME